MDDLWFSEYHTPDVRFSIRVTRQLWQEQSDYQTIAVYDSPTFGHFLTLDGALMLTERDEFIYHEMIVHVPMAVNREFYGSCLAALKPRGILVNQHESPFYPEDARAMQSAHHRISDVFPVSRVYQAHIPTYPSGHWLFGFASKGLDPLADLDEAAWLALGISTRYYRPAVHRGAFALPAYVEELLQNHE